MDKDYNSKQDKIIQLNEMLDAEADQLCHAEKYQRSDAGPIPGPVTTNAICKLQLERSG